MRTSYLSSLVFALLASASVAVNAAPASAVTTPAVAAAQTSAEQDAKVNINTANAETLQKGLSGVGAAKAGAIVAYREENGAFTSVDELIEVKGIGKALLDKNRDRLALE
ncbi:MAG TPA: ComEA family DNA-binding protein [Pseudomonas sp.]|jgi:competence protein ComEA|nr:ComEA family DNA-binding protein [Pseudomonas sp.]